MDSSDAEISSPPIARCDHSFYGKFANIIFASDLAGGTINLTEELVIDNSLTITAGDLTGGIVIDGGGNGDFVQDLRRNPLLLYL